MSAAPPSTRRDVRQRMPPDTAWVDLADRRGVASTVSADLVTLSASGFAFRVRGAPEDYRFGTCFPLAVLRVHGCRLRGEAVVRNARAVDHGWVEVGCLFYPTADDEERWMTLRAGLELATAVGPDRA